MKFKLEIGIGIMLYGYDNKLFTGFYEETKLFYYEGRPFKGFTTTDIEKDIQICGLNNIEFNNNSEYEIYLANGMKYYLNGVLGTSLLNVRKNGLYIKDGVLGTGYFDDKYYLEGKSLEGLITVEKLKELGFYEKLEFNDEVNVDSINFKNGQLFSGVCESILYKEGIPFSGVDYDSEYSYGWVTSHYHYTEGKLSKGYIVEDDYMFFDGICYTGLKDDIYYKNGSELFKIVDGEIICNRDELTIYYSDSFRDIIVGYLPKDIVDGIADNTINLFFKDGKLLHDENHYYGFKCIRNLLSITIKPNEFKSDEFTISKEISNKKAEKKNILSRIKLFWRN